MRRRSDVGLLAVAVCCACGGPLPTSGASTGGPAAVAQVRLFDPAGRELTVHTGLPDDQSVRLEVRLYASDGHRLTDIVRGVELALQFTPDSLATAVPYPGQPLLSIVTPTAPSGTRGSQTVSLHFPGDGSTKSFGPFHVAVERGGEGGEELRLFDVYNAELTRHIPLLAGEPMAVEVRLYDAEGRRSTSV